MWFFVLSRLDYCNSLLIDINCDQMYRLQKIQNHAAKIVFRKSRYEHVRPLLKAVQWLQVKERIVFKISTIVFSFLDGTVPSYLSPCLCTTVPVQMGKTTLSWARSELKGFAYRSSVQAARVRNTLPAHIPHCSPLPQFKTSHKTFFCVLVSPWFAGVRQWCVCVCVLDIMYVWVGTRTRKFILQGL